jgi:glycosyltransferase involved in cell wall biosynthesis
VAAILHSAAWSTAAPPRVSVVVSTYGRAAYLPGLLDALQRQEQAPPFEVVVADDGSPDATWQVLGELAAHTPLPFAAVRLAANAGAGTGRNRAVAVGRAPLVAFTDDDCLPAPGWLAGLCAGFADPDVVVVQGRTEPEPVEPPGVWGRSLWVTAPTPWLETCNVGYRRCAYDAVGGFDEDDPLFGRSGKGFGEDTWLGHRVLAGGGRRAFAPGAVVHHRWRAGSFADHVRERRLMREFPQLAGRIPAVADACWHGIFLSRRTAAVDLAVVAVAAAALTRRPGPLVGVLPWLRTAWGPARARRGTVLLRLAQGAVADLAGLAALALGSAEHRRVVL